MAKIPVEQITPLATIASSGYGDGYGSGSGYGSGDGSGDGSGSGSGDGSGSGYGDGSGSGSGYGDGSGSGSGDGYWLALIDTFSSQLGIAQAARLSELRKLGAIIGYWKSDADGLPSNGGSSSTPAMAGQVAKIKGPLKICTRYALHATLEPTKWSGARLWLVALFGDVQQKDDKLGALEREIIGEVKFS